jgi:hypothetical protein
MGKPQDKSTLAAGHGCPQPQDMGVPHNREVFARFARALLEILKLSLKAKKEDFRWKGTKNPTCPLGSSFKASGASWVLGYIWGCSAPPADVEPRTSELKRKSYNAVLRIRLQTLERHRKLKPAKGMGRVQRACRRALIAHDGVVTTSQCIDWAYSKRLLMGSEKRRNDFNKAAGRALVAIGAKRIERGGTRGRPLLWASA